jgi:hypothetical protein
MVSGKHAPIQQLSQMRIYFPQRMFSFFTAAQLALATLLLCCQLPLFAAQRPPNEKPRRVPKTIWNFEGGVFLETDGNLAENVCFRLAGRVVAKDFFEDLKRVDDDQGTQFLRGKQAVTDYPELIKLIFIIRDLPCSAELKSAPHRQYITREMMSKLKLSLFWKRGVDLRPVEDFKVVFARVKPVAPFAWELAKELPEKLEWAYEIDIPSAGIPLTDGLVLIFRHEDGRIAARVAARL